MSHRFPRVSRRTRLHLADAGHVTARRPGDKELTPFFNTTEEIRQNVSPALRFEKLHVSPPLLHHLLASHIKISQIAYLATYKSDLKAQTSAF